MDETSRLVVQVSNQGINETTTMLQILANQSRNTEIAVKNLTDATLKHSAGQKQHTIANKETGDSFGSLALKIAGYSSALNLGISVVRGAAREMKDLAVQAVTLAGSFERSRVAWGVFLKDVEAGSQMFDQLYDVAQRTPLTFQGVESAAQMLKGFGLATEEIIPTLERMGDVARGNDETMQRLALAYGQALAQNRVLTRDLYQFVNAGVPIFEALSQVMNKTVHEVGILVSDGKVGFPEIEKALKALTDEGGQFHGMMEKTAETFEGKLSIAADNFKAVLSTIGREVIPTLKTALDELNTTMDTMISKSNALYYLRTGQGDPNSLIAGLKTIMERNAAMAENPLVKLTGFNWNIFHTAPDQQGGWQPLYSPLYENIYLQGIIDQIKEQQAAGGYAKAEQNRQGYRAASVPVASDRVPWRDILVEQKIPAYERPWVPTDQGTMVRGDLLSGTALVTQWLEQQKLGFENVRGTKFEEEFRKEFTRKAESLQEALLASGLWKVGESTVSVIDDYIYRYGWIKTDNESDPFKALQAMFTVGAKGQSGLPPPGDWSNAPSIAAQIAAMESFWMPAIDAGNEEAAQRYRQINNAAKYSAFGYGETYRAGFGLTGDLAKIAKATPGKFSVSYNDRQLQDLRIKAAYTQALLDDLNQNYPSLWQTETPEAREKEIKTSRANLVANNFITQTLLDSLDQSKPSLWQTETPEGRQKASEEYLARHFGGTGERYLGSKFIPKENIDEARSAALNALGKSFGASIYPSDPFWFADMLRTPMNGGVISESNYPEQGYALTPPWIIAGENELPRYKTEQERDRVRAERDAARYAALNAYGRGKYSFTNEAWRLNPASFYEAGYQFPTEEENRKRLADIEAGNFITQTLLDSLDQSKLSLWDTETPEGRGSIYTNPSKLLELNMRAFERAVPSGRWQERPIGINADTGDIAGYTVQQAYTDAEKYQEAQDNLTLSLANGKISTAGYKQALKELAEQYDPLTKAAISFGDSIRDTAINTLADEMYKLGDALVSGADGWESFGDAMGNTLETLLQMLPKLAIQVGLSMLGNANPADDPLAIGLIAGGLIGQVGTGMLETNAKGGVYNSPSLSMFSNGVYDRPQVFTFAKGGVFAESGPEAIMPLSRDSSGRLGVTAQSAGKIDIQVNNYSSTPISSKTKTVTDASGNRKIILTIRDMVRQEVATANAGGVRKS